MAELTGETIASAVQLVIQDHSQANPPANIDHQRIPAAHGSAKMLLCQCNNAGIIVNINRNTQLRF